MSPSDSGFDSSLCAVPAQGKCLHGSSCKYAHALGELEVGYVFAQPLHEQPQKQQQFLMNQREQQQQQQLPGLLPENSLPQDFLLLQQLAMQQAQGKLTRQQQQHMVEHQQLLMLLEAEAAGKAVMPSQDPQRTQVFHHPQQQQQQQALKRQIQDLQQRCFAPDLHSQQYSQQKQDSLPQFQTALTTARVPQQPNEQKEHLPQHDVGTAARSPGSLQFRLPTSKVPALSLRALATKQQQQQYQQQQAGEQLLQQLQSVDSWSEAPATMQIPSAAMEAPEQQQQQQQSELEEIVSRQQLMQQRLLLQQQRRLPGGQQAFAEAVLQHGWQRPAAGSADEAAVAATTAAAPGYAYRELNPWGQAVSRSTASTATGDDCYSFASLAAAAAVRKAEQSLKPPSPEGLQRQQQPQQQPQMMQQLQQHSLSRQGRELLQAVELFRHQQKQHQDEQLQHKEAPWALQVERSNTEAAPVVSPFGNYSLREVQSRMAALTLQPQQQQAEQQMEQQRQQQQLSQHRQLEGLLAQLARDQTEGLVALPEKEGLCGVDTQHQQQLHQQHREQQHQLPKLQLPSGITGSAPASYRLGKSPLHRPNGEDTPCIQQSASHPTTATPKQ
ncbi:zinc finger (CCCH type) protein, putative [Eimeria mitis]|uniref:Zinc finger (CCCH type) protein, putative n=1 Tax=Eimeria mitis TaxID=44415 RepID=U6KJD6_9EIME|nr:zinc finger (CCCH type) protein, putative [Eimeria mitis]CDJ36901.1 zinc finger (CCCH type) protein, putative [Eimeria mitis]